MESGIMSRGDKVFQMIINVILMLMSLAAILPFILLIMASITDESVLLSEGYSFFPSVFSSYAYTYLFETNGLSVLKSYGITFFVTAAGTGLSLLIGPMLAYPLSRADFKGRKGISFYVFFTMLFNGGLVPSYIMWTQIFHIKNTIFALIFPTLLLTGFNIMLLRSNFKSNIHPALLEAAKIDGAGELRIYFKIVLPLSLPIMATIGLMVGIAYWNDWINGLYYVSDAKLYSLQQLLNNILRNIQALGSLGSASGVDASSIPGQSIRMAMAVIGVVPILLVYPFFQKWFIKGISLGGVKE